jgi:hypothetical protein
VTFAATLDGASQDPVNGRTTLTVTVDYTPEPPPVMLAGMSAERPDLTGVTADGEFTRMQAMFGGRLQVRRGFNTGFPTLWSGHTSAKDEALGCVASVASVKSDIARMASGADDALVAGFVQSIPAGWPVTLIWQHEPENPSKANDPALYRKAAARFATVVHEYAPPAVRVGHCLMGYTFTAASGRNPLDWWPGDAAVDVVCPDPYSFTTTRPALFTESAVGAVAAHAFAVDHGKPFGIAEWGCYDLPGTDRAGFVRSGTGWLRDVGAEFACWFHNNKAKSTSNCLVDSSSASVAAYAEHLA